MKKNLTKIALVFAAWFLVGEISKSLAQSTNSTQASTKTDYNTIEWSQISPNELTTIVKNADPSQIPTNAWGIILKRVDWFQLPPKVQAYVSDNVDWSLVPSNILEYYNQPGAWPDSPIRRATFRRLAELLRSSVDTNWLANIADKLTNQPAVFQFTNRLLNGSETVVLITNNDVILTFKTFSSRLSADLEECADDLTNPKIFAALGAGPEAEIPDSQKDTGTIYFGFYSETGPLTKITGIIGKPGQGLGRALAFYGNGKLDHIQMSMPRYEDVQFNESGQLQHISWLINDTFSIDLDLDESGNPHVKLQTLAKHPPIKFQ